MEAHNGCAIAAMYGEVGWRDLKYDMDLRLLRFAGRLFSGGVPGDRWVMRVMAEGVEDIKKGKRVTPWWKRLNQKIVFYGLDAHITKGSDWRQHVDSKIAMKAHGEWRDSMIKKGGEVKKTMRYYCIKDKPYYEWYLREDWEKKREVFRIRTGQAMLNNIKARWAGSVGELCVLCRKERETEEHIVLECPLLNKERKHMLKGLRAIIGPRKWGEFLGMALREKMAWVLRLDGEIARMGRKELWVEVFRWVGKMLYARDRAEERRK